ncbi:MAG: hypothetical protein KAH31_06255 [Candidatus Sabulitectum sp.]|nr:hypothetical protein [Candidatus Sabulitectum sp.]
MWIHNHSRLSLWSFETTVSLLMALPGIGMIVASFLVGRGTSEEQSLSLLLLVLGSSFLLINGIVFALYFTGNRNRVQLMQYGISGTARILDLREERRRINGRPVYKFKLEVNDGFYPVREIEHRKVIPLLKVASLRKDMNVQIKVHPKKPGKILLLLD